MHSLRATPFIVLLSLISPCLSAAQAAIIVRESPLYLEANNRSDPLASLAKDAEVVLLMRKGGWYKVESTAKQVGWVRMLSVRFARETETHSQSLAELLGVTSLAAPASGIATGVRGATSGALADDDQDGEAQLNKVDSFVPTAESVSQFADEGELQTQQVQAPAGQE